MISQSCSLAIITCEVALDIAGGKYGIWELEHIPGITNVAADALSRLWVSQPLPFPFLGVAVRDQFFNAQHSTMDSGKSFEKVRPRV